MQGELEARDLSANRLAIELKLQSGRITDILGGKRGNSADTALRLGQFFGASARFWLNLQTDYDLQVAKGDLNKVLDRIEIVNKPKAA